MLRLGPQRSEDHAPSAVLHGLKPLSPRPTALPPMRHESYLMALQQVAILGMLLSEPAVGEHLVFPGPPTSVTTSCPGRW